MGETMTLKGGDFYVTEQASDAFRVEDGTLLVYIVPLRGGEIGRRSFLYEAQAGEVIPAFCCRDLEYQDWGFCFAALERCRLKRIENGSTKLLRERFAQKAGVRNYAVEGYNGALVDTYRTNTVTEDGFILRSQKDREAMSPQILTLIFNAFRQNRFPAEQEESGDALYDSAALLCRRCHIPILPYEKLKEACGEGYTLPDIARLSHFSYREVILEPGWHQRDSGPFLVFDGEKNPCLCLPKGSGSYLLYRTAEHSAVPVTKRVAESLSARGYMLYRPLPSRGLNWKDLTSFCKGSIQGGDVVRLVLLTVLTSLIGLLTPTVTQALYDEYIPLGAERVLFQLGCVLACFMLSNVLFSIVKNVAAFRISSRMGYDVQNALYDRLFHLPERFFRAYESADLARRAMGGGTLVSAVAASLLDIGVSVVFLLIYWVRMLGYSGTLTLVGTLMVLVYGVLYYLIVSASLRHQREAMALEGKADSILYQFLSGISKLRMAGVEDRALYEYLKPYVKLCGSRERLAGLGSWGTVLGLAAGSVFSMVLYAVVVQAGLEISVGVFLAFQAMFGAFAAQALQAVEGLTAIKSQKPALERLKPILEAAPELDEGKELPGEISGAVEINNVSFSYSPDSPMVLEDIDLHIRPGEYVGIVGPSGCGKSTLLKLLLGFEIPTSGKIYYDNKDIESLDKRELRKKMGVVLQDGKLISGSIFENITITAPRATVQEVQEVVRAVGLEKDISQMPMGLHTILSEDCGTISGGQQQRILIARAILSKPRILLFDEATSALDNVTQKLVCDSLDRLDSTRIVIAHRLSTILNCDRIIVLDGGRVVEEGNYETLMARKGLFYRLASRQM